MINDDIIKKYYKNKVIHSWDNIPQEHKEYLKNRFTDSESYKESVWRILYNIEIRPICPVCGNKLTFYGKPKIIFSKTCSKKCGAIYSQNIRELTCQKKLGVKHPIQSNLIKEKYKKTCLKKYGVDNTFKLEKIKETRKKIYGVEYLLQSKIIREKIQKTFLKKYGYITPAKNKKVYEKRIITCLKKYGGNPGYLSKTFKAIQKQYLTKKQNNSFNTSKTEDQSYILLKEKYPDVLRQYRSKLYPFNCDFYIPSIDLYIECQYGQFHHKRPYIGNEQDLKDIEILKERANRIHKQNNVKLSRYDVELETWTIRDVNKRNIAKENNLNYIEFWNINELKNWLNSN